MGTQKSTHCKICKESFEVVTKYVNHAMCYDCYLDYQRNRKGFKKRELGIEWKIQNRRDIYRERVAEMRSCKTREEWRAVISRNFETAIKELGI